jgi:Ca2+-binding RTX toxin-like protein
LTGITRIDGGAGNDRITGSSGNDVIGGGPGHDRLADGAGDDEFQFATGMGIDTVDGGAGFDWIRIDTGGGSGGWLEALAPGSTPTLGAGDWLLELNTGESYVLHGSGGTFDFAASLSGSLTGADGSEMTFRDIEGVHW